MSGLGLFVDLSWGRFPLWVAAAGAGALAFAAMGLAVGTLTREVRAASLLCVMVSLPLTFLALVPSGSVAPALYDVVQVISAVFPFSPTLDAMDSALNDSGDIVVPLLHLAALSVAFGVASRLGLRPLRSGMSDRPNQPGPRLILSMAFPATRLRRLRRTGLLRDMVRETELSPSHLVQPMFVELGTDSRTPVEAMPGVERLSISHAVEEAGAAMRSGSRRCCCSGCRRTRMLRGRAPTTARAWCSWPCARSRRPTPSWW